LQYWAEKNNFETIFCPDNYYHHKLHSFYQFLMSELQAYLLLGFDHITDSKGYDHILFIMALCTIYNLTDWKKVLILVTAFTIGHSVTLAMATLGMISISSDVIELLIPVTILCTAVLNLFQKPAVNRHTSGKSNSTFRYLLALGFGLIHGLGFSNYLRALLGKEADIVKPLIGFNVGLELGQLIIVFIFLTLAFILTELVRISKVSWNQVVSGIIFGMAFSLILQNDLFQSLTGM
jgi:hypothetical protein